MNGYNDSMVVRFSTVRAAVLGLLALLLAAPASALPRQDGAWIELRSPHFTLFSNSSEWATRRIAVDLEQLRSALAQLNPQLELTSPVPTWIHVFRDTASFQPYRPLYHGRPQSLEGYFFAHPYGNYVGINADPRGEPTQILYHEYLHDVLRHNFPEMPLWLNEGLAEYYSTFAVAGSNAKLGVPVVEHVYWLGRNALIPLRELVAMTVESRDYHEGKRRGVFYAQSWVLVHYLLNTPERREQTARYLQDLFQGTPGEEALQSAFGDLAVLERDLRAYAQRGVFDTQRLPIRKEEIAIQVRSMARADLLVRLGDLLLQLGEEKLPASEEHYRAAVAADPKNGAAMAGLGRIAEASGRLADARTHYLEATQLAPDDFFLHYLLGVSLVTPAPDPQTLPQARAALQRAVDLRPDFAEGWGRLAQVLSHMDPFPPEALHVFETAWRLLPLREDFAFNLALIYAQTGEAGKAEALIEKVLVPRRRPELAEKAREAVFLGAWRKIEDDLIKTGKLDKAVPALEALLPRVQTHERRQELQKRIEEIYGVLDYNSFADRYNRAIDYLNAGRDAEAIALLEELSARTRNPGQAAEARKLLERVKAGPKGKG